MLNRCVVVVKAKPPLQKWLQSLPDPISLTLDEINQDSTVYLLPDYEENDEQRQLLRRHFDLIFEEQLAGWWQDEAGWPTDRDLKLFDAWFEVEFHSVVLDLVDGPLTYEECLVPG